MESKRQKRHKQRGRAREKRRGAERGRERPEIGTADLHAEGQVDPGAEGGADSPGGEAQVFEELGEGLGQQQARTLLRDHHTAPHTRQVQPSRLERHRHTSSHVSILFVFRQCIQCM